MASHNTYHRAKRGFTLVEVLVSIAIMLVVLSLGLFMSFDSYRSYLFRGEESTLISILERARSEAMSNYYNSNHGVCYDDVAKNYVMFRGDSFSSALETENIDSNPGATITSSPTDFLCSSGLGIIFARLSGDTSPINITLTQGTKTVTISINKLGKIEW